MIGVRFMLLFSVAIVLGACKKNNSNAPTNSETKHLPGTLYWNFAGEVGYQEFKTGKYVKRKMSVGIGSSRFHSFDISWDSQNILLAIDPGFSVSSQCRIVYRKNTDGLIANSTDDGTNQYDFMYEWDRIWGVAVHISPNGKYAALDAEHFADQPIVILDITTGEIVSSWLVEGISFLQYGSPLWTADNTVYFRIADKIYKSSPANHYQSAPRVAVLPAGASSVTINPQGTKMVFRNKKHLWMADIDGSNAKQITTGRTTDFINYDGENDPVFSPDGKYIAFTGSTQRGVPWSDHNYPDGSWVATVGGSYAYVVIIPADGKLYDLDDKNGGAIWLKEPGGLYGVPSSHWIIWR